MTQVYQRQWSWSDKQSVAPSIRKDFSQVWLRRDSWKDIFQGMTTLSRIRREVAGPMFGESPDVLRERLKATYRLMKEQAEGQDIRQGAPAPGTARNAAILVLTATLGGASKTAYQRVKRLWEAEFEGPGKNDPVTGGRQFGWALKTLLSNAAVRAHLDHVAIVPSLSVASLVWTNGNMSTFHPFGRAEWAKTKREFLEEGGHAIELKLAARAFHRVAKLLAE